MLDAKGTASTVRGLVGVGIVVATLLLAYSVRESERESVSHAATLTRGNPHAGKEKIRSNGCGTCHTIPGVRGANGHVGPPLAGIGSRMYIAGLLSNSPANLVRWIRDPPSVDSLTAMPNVGLTEQDARDIAAYLYTLP